MASPQIRERRSLKISSLEDGENAARIPEHVSCQGVSAASGSISDCVRNLILRGTGVGVVWMIRVWCCPVVGVRVGDCGLDLSSPHPQMCASLSHQRIAYELARLRSRYLQKQAFLVGQVRPQLVRGWLKLSRVFS